MENYQYPSYPDSGDSSPRSREIDFENPAPWDEQQSQNYRAKFMCSYGGKIQPRTHDNQLSYVGGDTKILAVDRTIKFPAFLAKLAAICDATPQDLTFKYQLPGEDLDALISVTNDDDLEHMMHEYDRLYRPSAKPVRMRLFLFTLSTNPSPSFSTDRDRFVEALNSGPIAPQPDPVKNPPVVPPPNVDYLFGLDKAVAPPPHAPSFAAVKFHDPVPEPVAPPPEYQSRGGVSLSDRVGGPDPNVNSIEIQRQLQQEMQRLQIAESEYRRRSEDGYGGGGYAAPGADYYVQKVPEKVPPPASAPPPAGVLAGEAVFRRGLSDDDDDGSRRRRSAGLCFSGAWDVLPRAGDAAAGGAGVLRGAESEFRGLPRAAGVRRRAAAENGVFVGGAGAAG
ncbi:octicosapeptide/Phox/Bem1p domain-containing protein [Spatholobus suberectus]|nr:octicosapeptide/Phox/Bem1p domain-containing protein [Spatholobus suberectus]